MPALLHRCCTVTAVQLCYCDTLSCPSGDSSYLGHYKNYWLTDWSWILLSQSHHHLCPLAPVVITVSPLSSSFYSPSVVLALKHHLNSSSNHYIQSLFNHSLTSSAIISSVTWGRAKIQKMVTPRLTRSTDSETDGHGGVITVALHCGESVVNWPFVAAYQLATLRVCPV